MCFKFLNKLRFSIAFACHLMTKMPRETPKSRGIYKVTLVLASLIDYLWFNKLIMKDNFLVNLIQFNYSKFSLVTTTIKNI